MQTGSEPRLIFVRLAHDRRFVGLFLFVLVLIVFIRISGRHRVAHDHEGTPVNQPGGRFLGDVWCHVVAPRVWTLGDFTPSALISAGGLAPNPFSGHASGGQLRRLVNTTVPIATMSMLRIVSRITGLVERIIETVAPCWQRPQTTLLSTATW